MLVQEENDLPNVNPNPNLPNVSIKLNTTSKRLKKELADIKENPPEYCTAGPKADNLFDWIATITGPKDTPYANGIFFLELKIPNEYPFKPPTVLFKTRIYHCNINSQGQICLSILKGKWTPIMTIYTILQDVIQLLREPNPEDPLVGSIGIEYLSNRKAHDERAKDWTRRFACF